FRERAWEGSTFMQEAPPCYPRYRASHSTRAFAGRSELEGLHPAKMPPAPRDDRSRLACATLFARAWPGLAASPGTPVDRHKCLCLDPALRSKRLHPRLPGPRPEPETATLDAPHRP